ncbi:hypothetical protein EDD18DRAFT_841364 [Armillaria luteobubalina]|uniref:Thioester reductase (TE) domain-containing protein n=1 Tax=Armillaria luteobubalina TaxID=153913 RepID=A0AA39P992_9AGAR|nr:hypothetical protein EDD18DRAFT_841364 [Armillaria luteobubalina]
MFVVFVSSTSAIDTEHYVRLSQSPTDSNRQGVSASDVLGGARASLKPRYGYGRSQWVSEKLLFKAERRVLRGRLARPGYVVGDSQSTVTDTNDVIWRMVKGCIRLGLVPDMNSTVDMVLVEHIASCTRVRVLPLTSVRHMSSDTSLLQYC